MSSSISSTDRRGFLQMSLAAGAMLAGGALPSILTRGGFALQDKAATDQPAPPRPLKILILGGTQFIGPALVEIARSRGHAITVFNRGITEKKKGSLGEGIERLVGDRDPDKGEGLKALQDKKWDVCIDDSGFFPRHVKASAELLAPNVRQYVFVSTISVYADNSKPNQDEDAPLATLADPDVETMGEQMQFYGGLKVLCEQAAEKAMPGRTALVRPGFIVGPGDSSDRFTYWPWRVQHSGLEGYGMEMLAPGNANDPIQVIDVRDLAAFLLHLAENNTAGTFNACGPDYKLTMGKILDESKRTCVEIDPQGGGSKTQLTWVSAKFIHDSPEQIDTTIWVPPEGESMGFHQWSNAHAIKAGLTFRPIFDTIKDMLTWFPKEIERRVRVTEEAMAEAKSNGKEPPQMADPHKIRGGITPEVEAKVLAAWHEHEKTG